jgi:Tfp pilus assembly protein PilP
LNKFKKIPTWRERAGGVPTSSFYFAVACRDSEINDLRQYIRELENKIEELLPKSQEFESFITSISEVVK